MHDTGPELRASTAADPPLRATIDADAIQTTVSLVDAVVDECHVHFDDDGLRFRAVDPATVAFVEVTLEEAAFEAYEADSGHVAVNLDRLGDVVGIAERGQPVQFALDEETHRLEVRIGGLAYTLALLDPETVRSPLDRESLDLEYAARVVTDTDTVSRAVRAADMVSNHVALGIDPDAAAFYAEADGDTDDVSLTVPEDDLVALEPGEAHSLFSVDYLTAFDRATPGGLEADLRLGTESPLEMRYEYADGAGTVEYLLSPRIARD